MLMHDFDYSFLVFDIEKQLFHVEKCPIYISLFYRPQILVQEDQVFGLFEHKRKVTGKKRYDLWNELSALRFQKNGCLVRTGIKWKINKRKFSHKDCRHDRKLRSAIFIENIKQR